MNCSCSFKANECICLTPGPAGDAMTEEGNQWRVEAERIGAKNRLWYRDGAGGAGFYNTSNQMVLPKKDCPRLTYEALAAYVAAQQ